jgi:histidinol-phosphate aminotransferase
MSLSRRRFLRSAGLGSAGILGTAYIIGRGREGMALEPGPDIPILPDEDYIRIGSNENARGPGARTLQALHDAISYRAGRGYPPDHTRELVEVLARVHGVPADHVVVATGSNAILAAAVHAFCTGGRRLVTAAPTYHIPEQTARRAGIEVAVTDLDRSLGLDLDAMAAAAPGAGLVFLCNPNNPTGTALPASTVEDFIRQVKRRSPETAILVDEAYLDYAHDPAVDTAIPLVRELPGVFVSRTFSKAHGMAGLRVGYAVGDPDTVSALSSAWHLGSMNTLSAAAAIASIQDTTHLAAERAENARVRDFVVTAFRDMGYAAPVPHTNCFFVELGRPAAWFRDACMERGVQVARDFPPLEATHSRISLGTMEEMERAVAVFRQVLRG